MCATYDKRNLLDASAEKWSSCSIGCRATDDLITCQCIDEHVSECFHLIIASSIERVVYKFWKTMDGRRRARELKIYPIANDGGIVGMGSASSSPGVTIGRCLQFLSAFFFFTSIFPQTSSSYTRRSGFNTACCCRSIFGGLRSPSRPDTEHGCVL